MSRQPKPFVHRGWYITKLGSQETKLAEGKQNLDAAQEALLELQLRLRRGQAKTYPQLSVRDLCERFMDTVEVERSHATYLDYKQGLQRFLNLHVDKRARDITKVMALDFRDGLAHKGYKPKTVNNALIALKACYN